MIPARRSHLYVAAITHPGMKRKNNEDRYAVSAYQVSETHKIPSLLAIVSDGIGGHRAGEVAAELAVEIISHAVSESDASQPMETLRSAIVQAGKAVRAQAEVNLYQRGMGATCVCAWVIGDILYTAYVGDSRIYLIREDTIHRLTTDHTWIQEALEYGALTPEQARNHPNAHVIRRYLGSPQPVDPDFRLRMDPNENNEQAISNQGYTLLPGDRLVLCTDGLTDLVDEQEILSEFKSKRTNDALHALVNLANQRGGHDNITIITLQVPGLKVAGETAEPESIARPAKGRRHTLPLVVSLVIIGVIIIAMVGSGLLGWYLLSPRPTRTITPSQTATATATSSPNGIPLVSSTGTPTRDLITITATPGLLLPANTYTPWPTDTVFPSETSRTTPELTTRSSR